MVFIARTMEREVRHPRYGFKKDRFGNLEVTQQCPGNSDSFLGQPYLSRSLLTVCIS